MTEEQRVFEEAAAYTVEERETIWRLGVALWSFNKVILNILQPIEEAHISDPGFDEELFKSMLSRIDRIEASLKGLPLERI